MDIIGVSGMEAEAELLAAIVTFFQVIHTSKLEPQLPPVVTHYEMQRKGNCMFFGSGFLPVLVVARAICKRMRRKGVSTADTLLDGIAADFYSWQLPRVMCIPSSGSPLAASLAYAFPLAQREWTA